jgi:hypothetical protein
MMISLIFGRFELEVGARLAATNPRRPIRCGSFLPAAPIAFALGFAFAIASLTNSIKVDEGNCC